MVGLSAATPAYLACKGWGAAGTGGGGSVSHSWPQSKHLQLSECFLPPSLSLWSFLQTQPYHEQGGLGPSPGRAGSGCRKHTCHHAARAPVCGPTFVPGEHRKQGRSGPGAHHHMECPPHLEESSSVQTRKVTNSCPLHPLSPVGSHLPSIARHKVGAGGGFGPRHVAVLSRRKACS